MGREVICNLPYNGIAAIDDFGAEHLRSGALILYTSQDSVLQLAAHVERPQARRALPGMRSGARAVDGRARYRAGHRAPVQRGAGGVCAHPGRRDFALEPPGPSYLQALTSDGIEVHGVGKISDLFAGVGVTSSHPGATNAAALASVDALLSELGEGLVFVNLIETDQLYGHRKDCPASTTRCVRSTRGSAAGLGSCETTTC